VIVSKISISVVVAMALFLGAVRLPGVSCVLSNAPSEKACIPGCCANKTCCETSQERTGPPVQPLAKSVFDQQNIATLSSTVAITVLQRVAEESPVLAGEEWTAHSLPPLALICIRLI